MELHMIGIDLGNTAFHLVGLNLLGEIVVRKKFSRAQLLRFTANLRVCLIGMGLRDTASTQKTRNGYTSATMHRALLSRILRPQWSRLKTIGGGHCTQRTRI